MAYQSFSKTPNNALAEPMFFGQPVNVARYDQQKHPIFEQLIEKQLSFFWRPEEVDLSRDRIEFAALPAHEQHMRERLHAMALDIFLDRHFRSERDGRMYVAKG